MPAPAGSVWKFARIHGTDTEIVVLSLGYEPSNGPHDFTVCLTLSVDGAAFYVDVMVGELDHWPIGLCDNTWWKRII